MTCSNNRRSLILSNAARTNQVRTTALLIYTARTILGNAPHEMIHPVLRRFSSEKLLIRRAHFSVYSEPVMETVNFKTTWGTITLTLDDSGSVVALNLPHLNKKPSAAFTFVGGTRPSGAFKACAERPLHLNSFQALEKMFPRIGTPDGTDFQKSVWRELKKIPRGQTRTYGEIASAIGKPKAVRAVGSACGANPLPVFIPCHRVVAKTGLGGFGSGLPWKILLLKTEGAL